MASTAVHWPSMVDKVVAKLQGIGSDEALGALAGERQAETATAIRDVATLVHQCFSAPQMLVRPGCWGLGVELGVWGYRGCRGVAVTGRAALRQARLENLSTTDASTPPPPAPCHLSPPNSCALLPSRLCRMARWTSSCWRALPWMRG